MSYLGDNFIYFSFNFFRYNYEWKIEEAQKNILRTHTTAVSAKQLYLLAQQVIHLLNMKRFKWLTAYFFLWMRRYFFNRLKILFKSEEKDANI